jgi:hypothetical protein
VREALVAPWVNPHAGIVRLTWTPTRQLLKAPVDEVGAPGRHPALVEIAQQANAGEVTTNAGLATTGWQSGKEPANWMDYGEANWTRSVVGPLAVMRRAHFEAVGGMEPVMGGWSGEDVCLAAALDTLVGKGRCLGRVVWHLWHPYATSGQPDDKMRLYWRYVTAWGRPALMRELVKDRLAGGVISSGDYEVASPRTPQWMAAYWWPGKEPKSSPSLKMAIAEDVADQLLSGRGIGAGSTPHFVTRALIRHGPRVENWWRW